MLTIASLLGSTNQAGFAHILMDNDGIFLFGVLWSSGGRYHPLCRNHGYLSWFKSLLGCQL